MVSDAAIYENLLSFQRNEHLFNADELDIRESVPQRDRHNSELSKMKLPGGN